MYTCLCAVDVGKFYLQTSQYAINDILGLQQAAFTRQEQLWHTECVHMFMQ